MLIYFCIIEQNKNVNEQGKILGDFLRKCLEKNKDNNYFDKFEQFLLDTTPIQREKFNSSIFDIMMKNNIKKTNSIDTNNLGAYLKAIKQLSELDNENKEIAGKFLKVFTKYYENKVTSIFDRLDFWKKNDTEG